MSEISNAMPLFEKVLSISEEEIEFELRGCVAVPWSEFLLNPRRLRGSDFLMRWSQGVWSEQRFIQAVNQTGQFFALMYGPSSVAPKDNIRDFELYFEKLEKAGLSELKRPDILIFRSEDKKEVSHFVNEKGGTQELPFIPEEQLSFLLKRAVIAVESENSLWKAKQMPSYGEKLRPMRRLGGKEGLPKSAVVPTIIVKEEDIGRLFTWQEQNGIPIHVWHAFYDIAFGIALDKVNSLIEEGLIEPTVQTFQAPGGSITKKVIYKVYYHYAYLVGETEEEPRLVADYVIDKNGHILPYVKFEGGRLILSNEVIRILHSSKTRR